jgi:dephospho-CoA kinase
MLNVGLTGGVGSGKSTIAAMLSQHGAGIVDADVISHEVTQAGGVAIDPLRSAFGAQAISADGALDRDYMRALVFSDVGARRRLEALLHPLIRAAMHDRAAVIAATGVAYTVLVVPLLIESGRWRDYVDRVLVVDCSIKTQVERVRTRTAMSEASARSIVAAQAGRQQRLSAADDVLFNEAPLTDVLPKVERLHLAYLQSSADRRSRNTL